jgi:hypothetical protein
MMRRYKRRRVFILVGIAVLLISISSVLLITTNVIGFDILGTTSNDCVPYNVFVRRGPRNYSVEIVWATKAECVGFVQYGKSRDNLDMVGIDLINTRKSREHSVTIEQLLTTETYYFLINSQEQAYGNNGVPLEFVLENL